MYIASISSLAIALIISITTLLTVIVIILTRNKAKTKAALDLQATKEEAHKWRQRMKILYLQSVPFTHKTMLPMATQRQLHRHNLDDSTI